MSKSWYGILHDCRICEAERPPDPLRDPWGQCERCGIVDWLCDYCPTCERCDCMLERHT